jgi:hypothetical protein
MWRALETPTSGDPGFRRTQLARAADGRVHPACPTTLKTPIRASITARSLLQRTRDFPSRNAYLAARGPAPAAGRGGLGRRRETLEGSLPQSRVG